MTRDSDPPWLAELCAEVATCYLTWDAAWNVASDHHAKESA